MSTQANSNSSRILSTILITVLYVLSIGALVAGIAFIFLGYQSQSSVQQSSSTATDTAALYAAYAAAQAITALGSPLVAGGFVGIAVAIFATIYRVVSLPRPTLDELYPLPAEYAAADASEEAVAPASEETVAVVPAEAAAAPEAAPAEVAGEPETSAEAK